MTILFWIFKSRINRTGQAPLNMRITLNGKRTELPTNISIDPSIWDKAKQRVKGNSPLVKEYNDLLLNLTTAAWNHYNEAFRKGQPVSGDD